MARTRLFAAATRALRAGAFCSDRKVNAREALQLERAVLTRRKFLAAAGAAAGVVAAGPLAIAAPRPRPARIAIIGGGLAGLVCADRLRASGYAATIYEASSRIGGRCWSLRGFFPGQVAERGGEFIDTGHQTMRNYATEFGLARENVETLPGEETFYFGGRAYSEEEVVDEYRVLVPRIRADLKTSSGAPTFFRNTPGDIALDQLSLADYLATRAHDLPLVRAVLDEAYLAEYGLETSRQSSLNMLLFLHADRRRKFRPFGVFSDERFHLTGGNDAIAAGIASRLPGPIETGAALTRLSRSPRGEYILEFSNGAARLADFVVCTVPFSVLRALDLDASLGLSPDQRRAIATLGYGTNAKTMVGFSSRPWAAQGGNGTAYSDLANLQTVWETNPANAGPGAVLTDYASGDRGRTLNAVDVNTQVDRFVSDADRIWPGTAGAAVQSGGAYHAFREHWPSNPLSRGSYTCYEPGQFTGLAGLESVPAGGLKFAGEHTDSFYSWQGFMEGACLSGLRAAGEVLADLR